MTSDWERCAVEVRHIRGQLEFVPSISTIHVAMLTCKLLAQQERYL